jgi:glutamate dehydrogenase (NAD(P)+)
MDAYSMQQGETILDVVTGKAPVIGGSHGREEAPGRNVATIAREAANYYQKDITETTVDVQGFGSVGANAARLLNEWGADVVAVSDVNGGVYDTTGLDTRSIPSHHEQPEGVMRHGAPNTMTNEEFLELDVDVLIPAAIGDVITEENAGAIRADIVKEGVNRPTTAVADEILEGNDHRSFRTSSRMPVG